MRILKNKPTGTMTSRNSEELTSNRIKVKGVLIGLVAGSNDIAVTLPAEGQVVLGVAFNKQYDGNFSLTLNNETVHEKIDSSFAVPSPVGGLGLQPYFPINRKLQGRDDMRLSINTTLTTTVNAIFYYK